jgi:tetratricopeptide (TPR) repeat protein
MYRPTTITVFVLATAALAAGCGRTDRPKTTSESVGANTPTVSASTSAESIAVPTVVEPVTYEAAESTFHSGRYSDAAQLFTRYTESHPENPWGYYMLGISEWKAGQLQPASEAFDRALELDSTHQKSLLNSGRVLLEMNRSKEALARIESALALEPTSSEGLRLLGRVRYQLGQTEQAIDAYHRALALDDHDVWAMNNLGLIYIEQDQPVEALPPLARAVEIRGNSPVFQNNLGTALERSGHPAAAAKAYEAAIAVDSTYPKAATSLARVTAGEQSESEPVDLAELSARFQAEIESWKMPVGLSDSTQASVESVTDTLEDFAEEE